MQSEFTSAALQRSARASAVEALPSPRRPPQGRISSRVEFCKLLRRAGYSLTQAQSLAGDLPDPIDFERDGEALLKRGLSLDGLISARGGSP
jgi:hypothetical protein